MTKLHMNGNQAQHLTLNMTSYIGIYFRTKHVCDFSYYRLNTLNKRKIREGFSEVRLG